MEGGSGEGDEEGEGDGEGKGGRRYILQLTQHSTPQTSLINQFCNLIDDGPMQYCPVRGQ